MMRALIAAGAVLVLSAPAFAESSTVTIEKQTYSEQRMVPESSGSTVSTVIVAPTAPPAPEAETPPPPPGPRMVWTPGHWQWDPVRATYAWVSGKYLEPPRAHAAWVPGHWKQEPRGWVWVGGHWD